MVAIGARSQPETLLTAWMGRWSHYRSPLR